MTKPVISADSHIAEPPNCYLDFIDPKFRDRAPHMIEHEKYGDIFVIDGLDQPVPMGLVAAAGRKPEELKPGGMKFADLPRSSWDAKYRVADQDRDGVAAELIYPTVGMMLCNHPDVDYQVACFNAYNRWNTRINVANTTDQPANVTVSYPGAARPDDHLTLAPFSSDYVFTPANAPEQTGFSGTAIITADQPVAAVVDEVKYGTGEAISYSASGVAASELTVPLVFRQDQDGVHNDNSGVNLSNPNDHDVTVEIQILDELGVPVGGTITVNLPANQGNFAYLPSTAVPPGTRGAALIHTTDGSPVVAISNDVSYDVAADGSAVFAAVSGSGFYRVGDAAMALP